MADLISRQAAQTELMMKCERYTLARESHGMGHVEWSDELIDLSDAMDAIRDLPSAQPDSKELSGTHKALDTVSRQAAIDALDKRFDNVPMEQTTEILLLRKDLRELPSAQPEPCKDAVSREAVSEWLKQYGQDVLHGKYKFSLMYIWKNLMDLPAVQIKRKNGKWIDNSPVTMKCNQCGFVIKDWDWHRFKCCPNCGANMKGEQDD